MLVVGKVYNHPNNGPIYITSGNYEVDGRLSNFWYWKPINEDGTLADTENHGYGGQWEELESDIQVTVIVKLKTK